MASVAKEKQSIDTVFMDPLCSGSDEKFLSSLVILGPKQVIYISCNPVTRERDLRFLTQHGYTIGEIQSVDMFPRRRTWRRPVCLNDIEKYINAHYRRYEIVIINYRRS